MDRPNSALVDTIAPRHLIDDLPIRDMGIRRLTGVTARESVRVPRASHGASLVAVRQVYDGRNGGVPSKYLLLWVEFDHDGQRWRTGGVRVLAIEASRLARDMKAGLPSIPDPSEPPRLTEKGAASTLRGVPVPDGYLVFVQFVDPANMPARTLGVVVLPNESADVVKALRSLARAA